MTVNAIQSFQWSISLNFFHQSLSFKQIVLVYFVKVLEHILNANQLPFYGGGEADPPFPMKNVPLQWPPILAQPP